MYIVVCLHDPEWNFLLAIYCIIGQVGQPLIPAGGLKSNSWSLYAVCRYVHVHLLCT